MTIINENYIKNLSININFLWNTIKKNKYPSIYKLNEIKKIIPLIKDRILIKNTVCLLNENHNYINYNYEHLIDLLNTINSRLEITIVYWMNIDNEICKLLA